MNKSGKQPTLFLTLGKVTKAAVDWAKDEQCLKNNISYQMLVERKKKMGMTDRQALTTPKIPNTGGLRIAKRRKPISGDGVDNARFYAGLKTMAREWGLDS